MLTRKEYDHCAADASCSAAIAFALADSARLPDDGAMSRPLLALLIGLVGIAGYVVAVMVLGDWVLHLHWSIQLLYFALAGIVWVFPARWLIFWSARR